MCSMEGDVESNIALYCQGSFKRKQEQRKEVLRQIEQKLNEKYGAGTVILTLQEQYRNMREKIEPCMEIVEWAREAIQDAEYRFGISGRGGTDGARLSFMGLPCPNLGDRWLCFSWTLRACDSRRNGSKCYHFNLSCEESFRTEKKDFIKKQFKSKEVIQIKIAIKKEVIFSNILHALHPADCY